MIRPRDAKLYKTLMQELTQFDCNYHPLVGIQGSAKKYCFIAQMIESLRRIEYVSAISKQSVSANSADPHQAFFNPLKAAIYHYNQGKFDEACWLIFLFVHFGESRVSGWKLTQSFYGKLGNGLWDWKTVNSPNNNVQNWLQNNRCTLKKRGKFGNHRKYQSLKPTTGNGTGTAEVIASYVNWVQQAGSHANLTKNLHNQNLSPDKMFDCLYHSLNSVRSFGRVAKFDYLTMLGKLGFFSVEPGTPYLIGSTGPLSGAKLLFDNPQESEQSLNEKIVLLGNHLSLNSNFKMQILEDALCNWQKSRRTFVAFRN